MSTVPSSGPIASTLAERACGILRNADPAAKATLSADAARAWRAGTLGTHGVTPPPERPARPQRPRLLPPREMPRRRLGGGVKGRIALLHALVHIELNAIDLAWDLLARFCHMVSDGERRAFADDWVRVAEEEARHFSLLSGRLAELGSVYGALPAHDGLWEAARETRHDLLARLALVPLVLEARGLDVTPAMRARLERAGDWRSAEILDVILSDEIGHVATGQRWFARVCAARGLEPERAYHDLVRRHFRGTLKRPFNQAARDRAGLPPGYYLPLATEF